MATITDATGNIVLVRDDYTATGNLGGLNAEVVLDCRGSSQVLIDLRTAAGVLTANLDGSIDGVNFFPIPGYRPDTMAPIVSLAVSTALAAALLVPCAGYQRVRVRVNPYTSGNLVVVARASVAALPSFGAQLPSYPSTLHVTATAAAGVAATLSLPAPGAGLRQYLTNLRMERFQALLGVAAATPVLVTTTNIIGSPVFSFSQRAAEQGFLEASEYRFVSPVQSAVQNSVLTIVAPAQAQTLWRLSAHYYVAP